MCKKLNLSDKILFKARKFTLKYNKINPYKTQKQYKLLKKNLGSIGDNSRIIAPFYCDAGVNIHIGNNSYINYNATLLDTVKINIGNNVFIAPNVSIYTIYHPLGYKLRNQRIDYTKEVKKKDNCWICGNVTILPGVTIGSGSVIGANSLVTHDIPANSLAYGSPAKVVRDLTEENNKEQE